MRVNVYAEELTPRVQVVHKTIEAGSFIGLRLFLELPISAPIPGGYNIEHRGPFVRRSGDDDSSSVTFWAHSKADLSALLSGALAELHKFSERTPQGGQTSQVQPGDIIRHENKLSSHHSDGAKDPYPSQDPRQR